MRSLVDTHSEDTVEAQLLQQSLDLGELRAFMSLLTHDGAPTNADSGEGKGGKE